MMRLLLYSRENNVYFGWDTDSDWIDGFFLEIIKNCTILYDFGKMGMAIDCDEKAINFFAEVSKKYRNESRFQSLKLSSAFCRKNLGEPIFLFNQIEVSDWIRHLAIQFLQCGKSSDLIKPILDKQLHDGEKMQEVYDYRAFGFDGIKVYIGEPDKDKRVCRFCGEAGKEKFSKDESHAISHSLGNTLLFCNEECKVCNHSLNEIENDLISLMRVRQALYRIKRKKSSNAPCVEGQDFVIKPDANGYPQLYLMQEKLPVDWKTRKTFSHRLNLKYETKDQDIYRALVKIVIDLAPSEYVSEFKETIKWLRSGSHFQPDSLPSIQYAILPPNIFYDQPVAEIYFYKRGDAKLPYCWCNLRIFDMCYRFVVPFASPDKGKFRKDKELTDFWQNLQTNIELTWHSQSLFNWWESAPWCDVDIDPTNPNIHILSENDSVFKNCKLPAEPQSDVYPSFNPENIKIKNIKKLIFKDNHKKDKVTEQEKKDFSLYYKEPILRIDLQDESIMFYLKMSAGNADVENQYFQIEILMRLGSMDFGKQVKCTDDSFGINYEFSRAIIDKALNEAQRQIINKARYSQFKTYSIFKEFLDNDQFYSSLCYELALIDGLYRFPFEFFHGNLPLHKRFYYIKDYKTGKVEKIYPHKKHDNQDCQTENTDEMLRS